MAVTPIFVEFRTTLTSLDNVKELVSHIEDHCPSVDMVDINYMGLLGHHRRTGKLLGYLKLMMSIYESRMNACDVEIDQVLAFNDPQEATLFKLTWY